MLPVIPVANDHSELVIVLVGLGLWVDDKGSTEAVDILTVVVGMHPVCTPLARGIDRDIICKSLARWDAAADKVMDRNECRRQES